MHRFFVNENQVDHINNIIKITGDDVKHILKVLRLQEAQEIEICDKEGMDYRAFIDKIENREIVASIKEKHPSKGESNIDITLYQGLPKSNKMELIIQKCTELGVNRIVPINSKRTISKIQDKKSEDKKLDRWQRIAYESSKQSKRGRIPVIEKIMEFPSVIEDFKNNQLNLVAYENEKTRGIKDVLEKQDSNIKKIGIIVGPEGGLEEKEIELLKENSVVSVSLGPRILRTETAGFVLTTILMYAIGDIGGR